MKLAFALLAVLLGLAAVPAVGMAALPPALLALVFCAVSAARNVAANLVASAFFRYTTWILPLAALGPESEGWSNCAMSERASDMRAALAARTISELLRPSAMMVVLNDASD